MPTVDTMELIRYDDFDAVRPRIEECLARFGWAPEHNLGCFRHSADPEGKSVFFESTEGYGLLAHVYEAKGEWVLFSEPLAPPGMRGVLVANFLKVVFGALSTPNVWLELSEETLRSLQEHMPPALHARRSAETLFWPTLNLAALDPSFSGPRLKPIRNAENRFRREHTVMVADARTLPAQDLHTIVESWTKGRGGDDRAYSHQYHAAIDDGFAGTDIASALSVDGNAEALFAGWCIPNSRDFYLGIALHSYAHWGLGEMLYMEALRSVKKTGYAAIDLGGSGKSLLSFKEKFGATAHCRTDRFSVARR